MERSIKGVMKRSVEGVMEGSIAVSMERSIEGSIEHPSIEHSGRARADAPEWCQSKWCYVDRAICDQTDVKQSVYFGLEVDLWYSYQKCGGADTYVCLCVSLNVHTQGRRAKIHGSLDTVMACVVAMAHV